MSNLRTRRDMLRALGASAAGAPFAASLFGQGRCQNGYNTPALPDDQGSGNRSHQAALRAHRLEDRRPRTHLVPGAGLPQGSGVLHRPDGLEAAQRRRQAGRSRHRRLGLGDLQGCAAGTENGTGGRLRLRHRAVERQDRRGGTPQARSQSGSRQQTARDSRASTSRIRTGSMCRSGTATAW